MSGYALVLPDDHILGLEKKATGEKGCEFGDMDLPDSVHCGKFIYPACQKESDWRGAGNGISVFRIWPDVSSDRELSSKDTPEQNDGYQNKMGIGG